MTEVFKLEIHLSGEKMQQFGDFINAICIEFPRAVEALSVKLHSKCGDENPTLVEVRLAMETLASNAHNAVMVGSSVAEVVGRAMPVRMDGGPLQ